ncbi:hypothetical protein KP78_15340 [Jeotgalibacillus soli]|uniref:Uncharacterized protein n=1 Tax=Jeotgalibacillus soli TaxID=889306 RepID=A0A0C2S3Q5_9BACL|nr:hypothetical protein KP78_15340 [Jeotgalibacillus soli]
MTSSTKEKILSKSLQNFDKSLLQIINLYYNDQIFLKTIKL